MLLLVLFFKFAEHMQATVNSFVFDGESRQTQGAAALMFLVLRIYRIVMFYM